MNSKMNPEIKDRWVAALRSGEYKQGTGRLRRVNDTFCCLGVLCDLLDSDQWEPHADYYSHGGLSYMNIPSNELREQVGLHPDDVNILWKLNDGWGGETPKSFEEIADYIEENL